MVRTGESGFALCLDPAIIRKLIQEIGVFGQAFFPRRCWFSLGGAVSLACVAFLSACSGDPGERLQSGRVLPWAGSEGRWVGSVTPVEPDCGLQTTGLMSIGGNTFAFDPFQSTIVLHGKIDPAGDLTGEVVHPVPGGPTIIMQFVGKLQNTDGAQRIVGTLASGRCHWSTTLLRG